MTNSVAIFLTLETDTVDYMVPAMKEAVAISVSPNPVRDVLSVNRLAQDNRYVITVADMGGYVWLSVMSRDRSEMKMNVSRLKAGNYLVSVNDGKEVKTVMFVKE